MRRVAGQLGVEAMSLYRHVADRAALLEGLADRLAAEIGPARHRRLGGRAARLSPATCGRSRGTIPRRSRWSARRR